MERFNGTNKRAIGNHYEQVAAEFLRQRGYEIIEQNYFCKKGEIDIVAKEGEYVVFVEVKYRKDKKHGYGMEAVTKGKQKRIKQAALFYMMEHRLSMDQPIRFDVISIDGEEVSLLPNAFSYYG